jgi:hypothetical protein
VEHLKVVFRIHGITPLPALPTHKR